MSKIVLMDVDNTLLDFHQCAVAAMTAVYASFGVTCTAEMAETFFPLNEGLWKQLERKEITKDQLFVHRWERIFDTLGLSIPAAPFEERFLKELATVAVPMDGALAMLNEMKDRYILCVASNAAHEQQCKRLSTAGMLPFFSEVFTSEKVGCTKPSAAFFDACLDRLGNPDRRDVLMLGDSLSADMQGAIAAGIRTCWFNPSGEPTPTDWPIDFVVSDLHEVFAILKENF